MEIVIHCMGMPFGPATVYEQSLGGSESAAFYLARELAARGHSVVLFGTRQANPEEVEGVRYQWIGESDQATPLGRDFEWYARNTPHDVLIIQRHPQAFIRRFAAKVCIWQMHDLALKRYLPSAAAGTWQVDAITGVSDWHCKQIAASWLINERVLFTVPNGVDPDLYKPSTNFRPFVIKTDDEPGRNDKNIVLPRTKYNLLFQSRPERGLEHLVRAGGIMDRLRNSPVHLTFCGYDNTVAEMKAVYEEWYRQAARLPNVSFIGALTKPQLAELQRKCDLLVYPTSFEEVSCITAMEAMHAGLPMLSSDCAALPETCAGSGTTLLSLKDGRVDEDAFVEWIADHCRDYSRYSHVLAAMRDEQLEASHNKTWVKAADKLEDVIEECFSRKPWSAGSMLRSAIERSDIDFARWYLDNHGVPGGDVIAMSAMNEISRLYNFTRSAEAYQEHYDFHQGEYYDGPGAQAVGEDVTTTTRFRGVRHFIGGLLEHAKNLRVLDYGCAHGHYTIPLAKELLSHDFHGVDISERAVAAAQGWAERDNVKNAEFQQGAEDWLTDTALASSASELYDIVLAGEVLEHARDWRKLLNLLRGVLKPGGTLVITTPCGRWEHAGTEAFRTGREHLVHFEKQDIKDICAQHSVEILHAPAGADRSDEAWGSWVWAVKPVAGVDFNGIDYARKAQRYVARETISACLIVKDGEKTLRKCVESCVDWVDEVRIFVDPSTTDRTMAIACELRDDFPNRPFELTYLDAPVLEMGFDAARNASIANADGDWILWFDADEEVHSPWFLHKLARPSAHDGFGFAQIHYALDPPGVLTTDYPTRFFRNNKGIKFYGIVHEHPELKIGDAVPSSVPRPEVKFLHCGYIDEATRRARHLRNFPLLKRDREKYPTRKLNQFLWLRDLAQGMSFDQERYGGILPKHLELAQEGIKLFEEMLLGNPPPRMLSDCLPYYSHCVTTLRQGFDAEVKFKTQCLTAANLNVESTLNGRFHNREFFKRLVAYFLEESTKTYEDNHL